MSKFSEEGHGLIDQGHFMSEEIADKVASLLDNWRLLLDCWDRRENIYRRNLDVRVRKEGGVSSNNVVFS